MIPIDANAGHQDRRTQASPQDTAPRAAEALPSSAQILANCTDMLFLVDAQQRLTACSAACAPLLGADAAALCGLSLGEALLPGNQPWAARAGQQLARVLRGEQAEPYEDSLALPDGQMMLCRVTVRPLGTGGACHGAALAVADITELARLRRRTEEATRAKVSFLANMSHEIRTPINAIKGLSELLALTNLNPMQINYTRNIVASTNTLLCIINDVLDFSKLDADQVELIEGDFSLASLIGEISNVMSLRASEKGLALYWDIDPTLPCALHGDDVRIKQILVNILGNAVKYTPKGQVVFRLYAEEAAPCGGLTLVCEVEDTGVGIREEELLGLFDAFYRADIHANRSISGPGLGLSISKKLVDRMRGSIAARSVYGQGSVFTVRLPLGVVDATPLACVAQAARKHVLLPGGGESARRVAEMLEKLGVRSTAVDTADLDTLTDSGLTHCLYDDAQDADALRRLRARMPGCLFVAIKDMRYAMHQTADYDAVLFMPILITELAKLIERELVWPDGEKCIDTFALRDTHVLIVDDNEINLLVSGEILTSYKAEVTCAEGGAEALALCEHTVFDMIFMDHMMPEIDGLETTLEIRRREGPNKNTPIVALTANVIEDMRSSYVACGMNDFLSKPIEMTELSRVLRTWLPAAKIITMQSAFTPAPAQDAQDGKPVDTAMEQLIISMDAFGMYVSDVMREIQSDYTLYLARMERIRTDLSPLVLLLREDVANADWDAFAPKVDTLGSMIHDVGARDCSGRARKLCRAAREHNGDYIRGDFFSLMDNMYMLQKKMEVAVPIAQGTLGANTPFGDKAYCLGLLEDMHDALRMRDLDTVETLMESLSCYSLDHDLDVILNELRAKLAVRDMEASVSVHARALAHCAASRA